MSSRKHISWKTKCASALLFASPMMYDDAKQMTEDQFLSLFEWDHNMFVSSGHEDIDKFWNLTPLFRKAHREKTKADAKIIAKGKRIRKKLTTAAAIHPARTPKEHATTTLAQLERQLKTARYVRKLQSRGFDKTLRKKMNGTVVKR